MLEVLYNDSYSQLSLVNDLNNERLVVADEDFKVYGSITYNPFEPTNEDIETLWKVAICDYYHITDKGDKNILEYRLNQSKSSRQAFSEWLASEKKQEDLLLDLYYRLVDDYNGNKRFEQHEEDRLVLHNIIFKHE